MKLATSIRATTAIALLALVIGCESEKDEIISEPASQYATSVIDYSSQYDTGSWSAAQTLGESDTTAYGDIRTAWAPSSRDAGEEYLGVAFDTAVNAVGVVIRETCGNGFVTRVDTIDANGEATTVWTGTDDSQPGTPVDFMVTWTRTSYLVTGVRIYIDTSISAGIWDEIDSVQLLADIP